jgi:hypothetical protein
VLTGIHPLFSYFSYLLTWSLTKWDLSRDELYDLLARIAQTKHIKSKVLSSLGERITDALFLIKKQRKFVFWYYTVHMYDKYFTYPDSSRISGATYVGVPQTRNWGSCTSVAKPKSATFRESKPFGLLTTCKEFSEIIAQVNSKKHVCCTVSTWWLFSHENKPRQVNVIEW